ncbi:MAG: transketolase [Chitinophagales bacterium]|nr:transketolase [Chitinophagales bacterium]
MKIQELKQKALKIKKRFLAMYYNANAGHIGSSLSCLEIVTFVKLNWMKVHDKFILSKGHAAACLYSVLAEKGFLSEAEIDSFYKNGSYLAAHPPVNKINGIPFATGSLGHGLSLAAGFGLSNSIQGKSLMTFCVTSDGELNEGSIWEAAMFIAHKKLNNVVWFIDRNRWQGFGSTEDVIKLDPLYDKLKAFGFNVLEGNGHDFNFLDSVKNIIINSTYDKPYVVICNTIKGNGLKFFEDTLSCHYLPLTIEQYEMTNLLNEN